MRFLALAVLLLAACSPNATAAPSGAACTTDTRAPGTLPDFEALLPRGMVEAAPTKVDSGVNCSAEALGTYAAHGVSKLRFAGATWDYGNGNATVAAVVATRAADGQPTLDPAWVEEFYRAGALQGRHTDNLVATHPNLPGAGVVSRLDVTNDLSLQTIVVFPAETYVHVVIVATEIRPDASKEQHDERVRIAVEVAAAAAP